MDDITSRALYIAFVGVAFALLAIWQHRRGVAYGRGRAEFKRSTEPRTFWLIVGTSYIVAVFSFSVLCWLFWTHR